MRGPDLQVVGIERGASFHLIDDRLLLLVNGLGDTAIELVHFGPTLAQAPIESQWSRLDMLPQLCVASTPWQSVEGIEDSPYVVKERLHQGSSLHLVRHIFDHAPGPPYMGIRSVDATSNHTHCVDHLAMARIQLPEVINTCSGMSWHNPPNIIVEADLRSYATMEPGAVRSDSYKQRVGHLEQKTFCLHSYDPDGLVKLIVIDGNRRRTAYNSGTGCGALNRSYIVGSAGFATI